MPDTNNNTAQTGGSKATEKLSVPMLHIRVHPDTHENVKYWSKRHELTHREYVEQAIVEKVARENGDYDLPTLEIARLNQLVDEITSLSRSVANLQEVFIRNFDTLVSLTRGDNYLLDDEDGEL